MIDIGGLAALVVGVETRWALVDLGVMMMATTAAAMCVGLTQMGWMHRHFERRVNGLEGEHAGMNGRIDTIANRQRIAAARSFDTGWEAGWAAASSAPSRHAGT